MQSGSVKIYEDDCTRSALRCILCMAILNIFFSIDIWLLSTIEYAHEILNVERKYIDIPSFILLQVKD